MLAIKNSEASKYGCPNCGCGTWKPDSCRISGQPTGTCSACGLTYQILNDNLEKSALIIGTGRFDTNEQEIEENPILINHPRKGLPAWDKTEQTDSFKLIM